MRKIVHIESCIIAGGFFEGRQLLVYALCDDGTLWVRNPWHPNKKEHEWYRIIDIPQN